MGQHFSTLFTKEAMKGLAGKKLFTILNEKDVYWQVKLDKEPAEVCTFDIPWGRHHFNRLPFGI